MAETLCFAVHRGVAQVTPEWGAALITVKASDAESMYIAASSRELAEKLVVELGMPLVHIISSKELTPQDYADFTAHRVAILRTDRELDPVIAARRVFPYEQHAVWYRRESDV